MFVEIALSALATTALTTLLLLVLVVIILLMAAFIVKANVLVVADVFSKSVPHILVLLVAAWSASVHTLTEVMEFSAVTALQAQVLVVASQASLPLVTVHRVVVRV